MLPVPLTTRVVGVSAIFQQLSFRSPRTPKYAILLFSLHAANHYRAYQRIAERNIRDQ
jgi:hypothetical protein